MAFIESECAGRCVEIKEQERFGVRILRSIFHISFDISQFSFLLVEAIKDRK